MKVIVVDDNRVELREVCRLVENSELGLELAGKFVNGKEAYEFIVKNEVDIVISDIEMPVMDGIELIRQMNQNHKRAEVIFISCYDDFDYIKAALKNDAFDYILKPINKQEFLLTLKILCDKCVAKKNIAHTREEADKKLEKYQKIVEEEFLRLHILGNGEFEKYSSNYYEFPRFQQFQRITVAKGRIVDVVNVKEDEDFGEKKAWIINLLKQQINSMASEYLEVYSIVVSLEEIAVLFMEDNHLQDVEGELIALKQRLALELGVCVSFGMSNSGGDFGELRELYLQAEEALEYTFGSTKSNVIRYDEVAFNGSKDIDTKRIMKSIKKIIVQGNKEDIDIFVSKYLETEMNRRSYVKNVAYAMMYSIEMVLLEYGQSLITIIGRDIWDKLNSFETIVNPTQWLSNMLMLAVDTVHFKSEDLSGKKNKIVKDIKHIIKQRYGEKLTVGMIADKLNYSSKYLSEVFLAIEKKSIYDYLTEYRMEVAKAMLKEPGSKIYVVVESVGYKRKTHFYDLFKSYVGVSPMEYKAMYSCEDYIEDNQSF